MSLSFFLSPLAQVDDEDLQDEPLQVTVLDHDTYSANDAIGKVYIDIDPLLCSEAASVISGWFPIYDTIHGMRLKPFHHDSHTISAHSMSCLCFSDCYLLLGIRGEINVLVKVELFNDLNRFRQSSCGVKFFCSKSVLTFTSQFSVDNLKTRHSPQFVFIDGRLRSACFHSAHGRCCTRAQSF